VKVTRLAFGTGSFSGQVQRDLGQDGFYATGALRLRQRQFASSRLPNLYGDMHRMLGVRPKRSSA